MRGEDPKPPDDPTSFCLPPGSRFYPSEQQLVCYYLTSKNNGTNCYGKDVIKELDLYNFNPFNLPESGCFRFGSGGRRRHWYCYVRRVVLRERGRTRVAGGGYWKKRGRVRDVIEAGAGKVVVGTRKSFDFYSGDSHENAVRTRWVLYEYALIDHHMGSFVLCRVFNKSDLGHNLSEHNISSCGEESVATVRHIGVQYDGSVTSVIEESKMHDKGTQNDDNEVLKLPTGQGNELDETISLKPVSEQDLKTILEGDYIEVDDLLCSLPGVD
ncbi:NAC domain-containing protein 72-like [Coffea eugenioides]|uniref:NAC domain-containing protein 72-like n=1 Tax=Coffea eugenioides TaxID=49369 RepID=UPI000F6101E9|nr:NAC domain-containing protein 72-like [Coffea eugenioides]